MAFHYRIFKGCWKLPKQEKQMSWSDASAVPCGAAASWAPVGAWSPPPQLSLGFRMKMWHHVHGECLYLGVLNASLCHLGHGPRGFACPRAFCFGWNIQKQDQPRRMCLKWKSEKKIQAKKRRKCLFAGSVIFR